MRPSGNKFTEYKCDPTARDNTNKFIFNCETANLSMVHNSLCRSQTVALWWCFLIKWRTHKNEGDDTDLGGEAGGANPLRKWQNPEIKPRTERGGPQGSQSTHTAWGKSMTGRLSRGLEKILLNDNRANAAEPFNGLFLLQQGTWSPDWAE